MLQGLSWPRWLPAVLLSLGAMALAGCSGLRYYGQAVQGHLSLMHAARPIADWLADPHTPPDLRARLERARDMRGFAVRELGLPDNASYRRYADLERPAALWNVVAAPPDSLVLRRWCFPVAGCIGYRGYYRREAAEALASRLQAEEGLEVLVYGVPMYSTLGWLNWLGGDPLLSTVIQRPEGELARIIFHELAHQQVYIAGDTRFNESYASAVALLGVRQWLDTRADAVAREAFQSREAQRNAFLGVVRRTRDELEAVYVAGESGADEVEPAKAAAMARFRARYSELRDGRPEAGAGWAGFDRWVREANNAAFGLQAAYDGWVGAFEALFACVRGDWPAFHEAVWALGERSRAEREAVLGELGSARSSSTACERVLFPERDTVTHHGQEGAGLDCRATSCSQ